VKFTYLILILAFSSHSLFAACKKSGRAIMEAQNETQSAKTEQEFQDIVIVDSKTSSKQKRSLKRYMVKGSGDDTKSILYFLEPANIKGAGLLSWKEGSSENQWLYVPELKKLQRIASGSKKNYFMGTDFTYADLDGESLKKNDYTCQQTIKCQKGKSTCYVIEAKPISEQEQRNIGYSKRMLLVDTKDLLTLKIIFYNLQGKKLKTAEYANWEQSGKLWRPNLAIMDRHGIQKTFIKIKKRLLNKKVDSIVFTKRYLEKEMHIK
jgi:hypothetical protein